MSPTKVLLAAFCMGMGALAFAAEPPSPATTPSSTDTTSPAAPDSAAADKAAADSAAADKAAADKAAADKAAADKAAADKAKSAATNAKTTAPGGITPEQAKTLRVAGYKADVRKGGEVYYCRYETQLGSRFETKTCGTPEDILRLTAESQDLTSKMQHSYVPPPSH
jgi:hypothetical protein